MPGLAQKGIQLHHRPVSVARLQIWMQMALRAVVQGGNWMVIGSSWLAGIGHVTEWVHLALLVGVGGQLWKLEPVALKKGRGKGVKGTTLEGNAETGT